MESLKELYRIGPGPSSSHTLAPYNSCLRFAQENKECDRIEVELYGSLSLTGKGHFTDLIIKKAFEPRECNVKFCKEWNEDFPNGFYIFGYINNEIVNKWTVFSTGGGAYEVKELGNEKVQVYKENSMKEINAVLNKNKWTLADYVFANEGEDIKEYLVVILEKMIESVENGIKDHGYMPGSLHIEKSAKKMFRKLEAIENVVDKERLSLMCYAYATSEQNASMGTVVTAPTLGSCGILASLMYYCKNDLYFEDDKLIESLAVASVFGNHVKTNGTISGAVGGCQAEIGVACSMAAAAYAYLIELDSHQIEYAAECAMEHHLGLTCDPVEGYVIIPCIERNAVSVLRAVDSALLAKYKGALRNNVVDFDTIIRTMSYAGKMMSQELKETSLGGLAKELKV